ncbi:hypothetical protein [Streptomyces sp. Z26]|uniref:hypothetical protein n=1 Tax=Streptomyces sp. Z26 TaxID=2500177 RepID=UPI000FC9ECCA|nr:hypothetical protein [Streptomyces sp. Z26]
MRYADDPKRLASLLRELADALDRGGVSEEDSSAVQRLPREARDAAKELDPPTPGGGKGRVIILD